MKKIFLLLILGIFTLGNVYSEPTASIAVENPRIIGNNFYVDIYFMRTNDAAEWYPLNQPWNYPFAHYSESSWVFEVNVSAFSAASITYENPTYIQGNYITTVAIEPGPGNVNVTSDYDALNPSAQAPNLPEDVWLHMYTVELTIASSLLTSGISWDELATGLISSGSGSTSVTESHFDSDCDIALNTNCWTG
ncbi:MAG: hypothetical protein RQ761_07580, partial [Bacteroidales bacterium]|nr:hypothetical protein [Bacteroidales bacterium]